VGNLPSKFGHARPLGSRIIRYVCDGRTDRRADKSNVYCPLPCWRGVISLHARPKNIAWLWDQTVTKLVLCLNRNYFQLLGCDLRPQTHARGLTSAKNYPGSGCLPDRSPNAVDSSCRRQSFRRLS